MKSLILFILLCLPAVIYAQSNNYGLLDHGKRKRLSQDSIYKKSEMYKSSKLLSTGGALIGLGGGLLGGSLILTLNMKDKDQKTAAQILAGCGGVLALIGAVLIGTSAEMSYKAWQDKTSFKFTGNSVALVF